MNLHVWWLDNSSWLFLLESIPKKQSVISKSSNRATGSITAIWVIADHIRPKKNKNSIQSSLVYLILLSCNFSYFLKLIVLKHTSRNVQIKWLQSYADCRGFHWSVWVQIKTLSREQLNHFILPELQTLVFLWPPK